MLAELGLAVLWMAAALAALQLLVAALALSGEGRALAGIVRPVAGGQGVLAVVAFAALVGLFAQTDLSVKLVAENSHSAKPLIYKIAGTWGNHEGSMLLWVTVMALYGGAVASFGHSLPELLKARVLGVQGLLGVGVITFILFTSNPFQRLAPAPFEGH